MIGGRELHGVCLNACVLTTSSDVFPIPTGATIILAQFHINHFRSIAWYNVILGICYVFLQIVMFQGESKCHCQDFCQKSKCLLPERSRFRKVTSCSNLCLILVSLIWPKLLAHSQSVSLGMRPGNLIVLRDLKLECTTVDPQTSNIQLLGLFSSIPMGYALYMCTIHEYAMTSSASERR